MKKYFICVLLLLPNLIILNGQTPYRPTYHDPLFFRNEFELMAKKYVPHDDPFYRGYILVKTDTIYCFVKNNKNFQEVTVKYKLTLDSKVQKINIKDVTEVFDNSFVYEKIAYNNYNYLTRVLIRDTVSLYEIPSSTETSFGTIYRSDFFLKRADNLFRIKKGSFKEDLKSILTNHPETTKKIDELEYKDVDVFIQALVNNYNTWIKNKGKEK